jgi:peptidoglycan hydrolase-like protein with peptidoglycan-binding domain
MQVSQWSRAIAVISFCASAILTQPAAAGSRDAKKALGIIGGIAIGGAILNELSKNPPARAAIPRAGSEPRGGRRPDADDEGQEGSLEERVALQKALYALGFDTGAPDGKFGQKARKAIRDWQKANGDEPTGRLTPKQRAALIPASLVPPTPSPVHVSPGPAPGPARISPFVFPPNGSPGPVATQLQCDAVGAWQRVRAAYQIHVQTLAKCENSQTGQHVIVLAEPPQHLVRDKAAAIVQALFSVPVKVSKHRHKLGFDGWVEDLVIVAEPRTPAEVGTLGDDIALLALYAFGSAYKAEVEDIARIEPAPPWQAPPALEVTAEELYAWLLGPNPRALVPLDGGAATTLQALADGRQIGTYQTDDPGLVVALVPTGSSNPLNDYVEELRRFAVDTDVFLGAVKLKPDRVALIGRERTTSFAAMPPLRIETILLLASKRSAQLAQSYERGRPFAGKLLTGAGDLFGWDWAPILLSNELIDTEFGSLLNFTDNMLKSWSESGKVQYKGFQHAKPAEFPFGNQGALKTMGGGSLTYNWNTAGVGYLSEKDGIEIFSIRNTGSLPVSYFPEGSGDNDKTKAKLAEAEDRAYEYFSSRRNPLLGQAVQYAGLYQAFQAFDVQAKPPQDLAAKNARMSKVEEVLQGHMKAALESLSRPEAPSTDDLRLNAIYIEYGTAGRPDLQLKPGVVPKLRGEIAGEITELDLEKTPAWRALYIKSLATDDLERMVTREELQRLREERRQVQEIEKRLDKVKKVGLRLALPLEQVRKDVESATEHKPEGWIKTPSIVVSTDTARQIEGGHNIGGRATRIEIDTGVPRGQPTVLGDYQSGRVIHLHPEDAPAGRELVRLFDREVGLHDAPDIIAKGVNTLRARLSKPVVARPVRVDMGAALGHAGAGARTSRGASASSHATPIGYGSRSLKSGARLEIEALAEQANAHIVVGRVEEGFAILRAQPKPPELLVAPNSPSLLGAYNRQLRQAALGPPRTTNPKILFEGSADDVARIHQTLAGKAKSVGEAGGKRPYGGDRSFETLVEGPESVRRYPDGSPAVQPKLSYFDRALNRAAGVMGKKRHLIRAEGPRSDLILAAKPQWKDAEINFPRPDPIKRAFAGVELGDGLHIVEVRVPVTFESSGAKSMLIEAFATFRDALSASRTQEIESAVFGLIKGGSAADVREALELYKTKMINEFGSERVKGIIKQEGQDWIFTEGPGAIGSAPRG